MDNKQDNQLEILRSIRFLKEWILTDMNELGDDTTSDYAKFILSGHKHIKVAIQELENIIYKDEGLMD